MRRSGALTLAKDQASCVVYGMPKAACKIGAVQQQLPSPEWGRR
ncbi:chemotaxis protein CheB [Paenibacillus pinihumi]